MLSAKCYFNYMCICCKEDTCVNPLFQPVKKTATASVDIVFGTAVLREDTADGGLRNKHAVKSD